MSKGKCFWQITVQVGRRAVSVLDKVRSIISCAKSNQDACTKRVLDYIDSLALVMEVDIR